MARTDRPVIAYDKNTINKEVLLGRVRRLTAIGEHQNGDKYR